MIVLSASSVVSTIGLISTEAAFWLAGMVMVPLMAV